MGFFSRLLGTKKEETPKELAAEEALEGGSELAPELAPEADATQGELELAAEVELETKPTSAAQPELAEPSEPADSVQTANSAPVNFTPPKNPPDNAWQDSFILALRQTEPTPGHWAATLVEGLACEGGEGGEGREGSPEPLFWQRLELLLQSLNLPAAAAALFQKDLAEWLQSIDYKWSGSASAIADLRD